MPLATATVVFVPLRNGLANLPQSLANMLFTANIPAQNAVVELEVSERGREKRSVYLGYTGLASAKGTTIEIDPTYASTLGITHGQTVTISVSTQAPLAHTIHLEPATSGDWEIVETHVAFLETYFINQIRTVCVGQSITVFPSPTSLATLKVTKIEPTVPPRVAARVSPTSEVFVAPKTSNSQQQQNQQHHVQTETTDRHETPVSAVVRTTVAPYLEGLESRKLYISGSLPSKFRDGSLVQVSLAVPAALQTAPPSDESEVARAHHVYAYYQRTSSAETGLSYGLSSALGLVGDAGIGAKVHVRSVPSSHQWKGVNATIRPYSFQTQSSKSVSSKSVPLTSEQIASLELSLIGKGLVLPPVEPFLPLGGIVETDSKEWGNPAKLVWGTETPLAESKRMTTTTTSSRRPGTLRPVVGQDKVVDSLVNSVLGASGVLLYGSRGCGKSVVINEAVTRLKAKHIKPIYFACGTYTEKALPTVRDALRKTSLEALWSSPSVVIFDDIDKLIPAQQEHSADSARQQQLAELFQSIWSPLISSGQVSLLASAQDQSEVNSHLMSSHLLNTLVHLKSPDKDLRELILRKAIETLGLKESESLDLIEVVGETEGYQPGDLWILVERLSSQLALGETETESGSADAPAVVTTQSILDAAVDFTPASLRGVKLEKPSTKWDDVGGLEATKRVVLETLEWPTKYAPIFANCPLRLRSGLLLYGYPGCGKTMLASAIASQTGLNFISVKGPEILNKYIGASEQSVRDLFDRAQAAKPCVLFFDEFDSIAPKRGHDATGVTDRVVNQLLTQMDGAEGLDGVYVLAATSRPDMIDSALLRPGRLDKSLLCGMPDVDDRHDIMMRAARKLKLDPSIDMRAVAEKTARFSGADLQALVYNAYLSAVHDVLDAQSAAESKRVAAGESTDKEIRNAFQLGEGDLEAAKLYLKNDLSENSGPSSDEKAKKPAATQSVVIQQKDIEKALTDSKPSISPQELARFQKIYAEFSTDRNGEMPPGVSSNEIGGRVTLQ